MYSNVHILCIYSFRMYICEQPCKRSVLDGDSYVDEFLLGMFAEFPSLPDSFNEEGLDLF